MALQEEVAIIAQKLPSAVNARKQRANDLKHTDVVDAIVTHLGGSSMVAELVAKELRKILESEHASPKYTIDALKLLLNNISEVEKRDEARKLTLDDYTEQQLENDLLPTCKQLAVKYPDKFVDVTSALMKTNATFVQSVFSDTTALANACKAMFLVNAEFMEDIRIALLQTLDAEATRVKEVDDNANS